MMQFKVCSCCNKKFIPASLHLYRAKDKWQCSYTCYRKEGGDDGKYPRARKAVSEVRTKADKR